MVKNLWNDITWVCMNRHEEPVPFKIMQGQSPFYACPKYMLKDENHPDGHLPDERACPNRISLYDETGLVEAFSDIVEDSLLNGDIEDFTGTTFRYKHIEAKVLRYDEKKIVIGLLNRKAVRS